MKKNDQRGIAMMVEVLAAAIVIGGIGFAGYRIMKARSKTVALPTYVSTTKKADSKAEPSWQKGDIAVEGKYADSSVVQVDAKTWRIYYGIQPEVAGNHLEVYSSTSNDGKTWKQDAGTRKTMATFPNVVKLKDGRYRMYFQNASVIKSAISTDGLKFTDETGTRIDKINSDKLTLDNVAAPTVHTNDDGTFTMVYRATMNTRFAADTPNPTTELLMWASSPDGLAWTKKGIAVDSRNDTLRGHLDGPDLSMGPDGKLHVYVSTYVGVNDYPFDGAKFGAGTQVFTTSSTLSASNKPTVTPPAEGSAPTPAGATAPTGPATGTGPTPSTTPASPPTGGTPAQPPGDPAVIKIGDTWFMYYGQTGTKTGIHYATYK